MLVSSALPDQTLYLIDASAVAANADGVELKASGQVSVEMDDADLDQDATSSTGASLVGLWQSGATALMAQVTFGVEVLRANAAVKIVNVAWNGLGSE
jgi:hypothetical protein